MSDRLRSDATQAIALNLHFAVQGERERAWCESVGADLLDALLDYLETHAEEWEQAVQSEDATDRVYYQGMIGDLLAALRVEP